MSLRKTLPKLKRPCFPVFHIVSCKLKKTIRGQSSNGEGQNQSADSLQSYSDPDSAALVKNTHVGAAPRSSGSPEEPPVNLCH